MVPVFHRQILFARKLNCSTELLLTLLDEMGMGLHIPEKKYINRFVFLGKYMNRYIFSKLEIYE